MPPPLLKSGDPTLGEVDKGLKNKLKWTWLDEAIQLPDSYDNDYMTYASLRQFLKLDCLVQHGVPSVSVA